MTERRGRKRGLRATLIHVSSGQIIYHLVQTNGVLDSLSEEGGGGWCVRSVRAASDAAAWPPSLFFLSPLVGPLLITPQTQALGPSDHTQGRRAAEEVPRLHFTLVRHFSSTRVFMFLPYLKLRASPIRGSQRVMHFYERVCTCSFVAFMLRVCVFMRSMWRRGGWGVSLWLHLDSGKQTDQPLSPAA